VWIARIILAFCAFGLVVIWQTHEQVGHTTTASITALVVGMMTYYSWLMWRLTTGTMPPQLRWFNVVLELFGVLAAILIDAQVTPAFGLGGVPSYTLFLTVAVNSVRLDARLCLFAGAVAALGYGLVATIVYEPGAMPLYQRPPFLAGRAVLLLLTGVLCALAARALRQVLVRAVEQAEERLRVRTAFGAYVAEQVVDRVLAGDLRPRTERRRISVVFLDIRGFTRLSERMDPEQLLSRLNIALEAFSGAVDAEGGIVNKYLGDGLMAIFGAPEDHTDHAARACRAASACVAAATDLATSGRFPDLAIGVGVHTGEVVVGDIGGTGHREYTAIGDVVNVASRVESANKELGTTALITREVYGETGDLVKVRELSPIAVRNRAEPVHVFELLGA